MKGFYWSNRFARALLIGLLVVLVASVVVGLRIGGTSFVGNLLGEIVGAAVAILIGLLVIDRFVEHRREQEWARVRRLTLGAIATHLCEIASFVFTHFQTGGYESLEPIFERSNVPNRAALGGFKTLLEELRDVPYHFGEGKSSSDVAVEFYEAVKWDLDQIQTVLIPRVIQSSTDQTIMDVLIEFDDARRELHGSIIGHRLAVTHSAFPYVVSLVEACIRVYRILCENWGTV